MKKFIIYILLLLIAPYAFAADEEQPQPSKGIMSYLVGKKNVDYDKLFHDLVQKVEQDYVDEVTDQKLIESALSGMLQSLDPHSSYLTEKEFNDVRSSTRGEFGGLGIELTMERGFLKVIAPYEDGPAYKAGLRTSDFITMIDGTVVKGLSLSDATDKLRGKPKTPVKITIFREPTGESLEMTVVRDTIKITPVRAKLVAGDVVVLRIVSFSENAAKMLKKEYYKLADQAKESKIPLKGVILDLRNNPGGLLDQSEEVTELFLEEGVIVSTKGRLPESNKIFTAKGYDITEGLPLVLLVNGGSASASEIVAGALQDNRRAMLVGSRTFGKGSVQTITPIYETNGAIKITTSRYYTPSGRSIQAQGIEPDVVVEDAMVTPIKSAANNTSESSLVGHLNAEAKGKAGKEDDLRHLQRDKSLSKTEQEDFQLLRAIDMVKGMALYSDRFTG